MCHYRYVSLSLCVSQSLFVSLSLCVTTVMYHYRYVCHNRDVCHYHSVSILLCVSLSLFMSLSLCVTIAMFVTSSGVARGGQGGASAPGRRPEGGAKIQPKI